MASKAVGRSSSERAAAARAALACAAALAVLLVAGGCGGGSGDASGEHAAEQSLSKPQYVKQAHALCLDRQRQITAELQRLAEENGSGRGPVSEAELARAFDQVILPGFRAQFDGLRALPPPRGDEDFLALMLLKFASSLEDGEEDLAQLFRVKASGYSEFAEGTLMTHEYGIGACGSLGRSPRAVYAALRWT